VLLSIFHLAASLLLALYLTGVFALLTWMLLTGITPKRRGGLRRPWTAEEYLTEPLAWPMVLLWAWIVSRQGRQ
jgi:hypothetical protein